MSDARKQAEEALAFFEEHSLFAPPATASVVRALRALLAERGAGGALHFVCTDFPGPMNECVFVECEDGTGRGVNAGEWRRRPDGLVELVVSSAPLAPAPAPENAPHEWEYSPASSWEFCRVCGVVRRADNQNKPCRGPISVTLRSPAPSPRTAAGARECTGIAALWCPVHGNCSCPRDEEGVRLENRSGVDCPLHGLASDHGDSEITALSSPAAPAKDEVREAATLVRSWQSKMNPHFDDEGHDPKTCGCRWCATELLLASLSAPKGGA